MTINKQTPATILRVKPDIIMALDELSSDFRKSFKANMTFSFSGYSPIEIVRTNRPFLCERASDKGNFSIIMGIVK